LGYWLWAGGVPAIATPPACRSTGGWGSKPEPRRPTHIRMESSASPLMAWPLMAGLEAP
jgi:hypothetical protein